MIMVVVVMAMMVLMLVMAMIAWLVVLIIRYLFNGICNNEAIRESWPSQDIAAWSKKRPLKKSPWLYHFIRRCPTR